MTEVTCNLLDLVGQFFNKLPNDLVGKQPEQGYRPAIMLYCHKIGIFHIKLVSLTLRILDTKTT